MRMIIAVDEMLIVAVAACRVSDPVFFQIPDLVLGLEVFMTLSPPSMDRLYTLGVAASIEADESELPFPFPVFFTNLCTNFLLVFFFF